MHDNFVYFNEILGQFKPFGEVVRTHCLKIDIQTRLLMSFKYIYLGHTVY